MPQERPSLAKLAASPNLTAPEKVAFAGLDATATQSAAFEAAYNVMSKRGSPYLRKAIFHAILVAAFTDPV